MSRRDDETPSTLAVAISLAILLLVLALEALLVR